MVFQPEIPSERVAVITFFACQGAAIASRDCGIVQHQGTRRAFANGTHKRVVPFVRVDGEWVECSAADETAQDVPPTVLQ